MNNSILLTLASGNSIELEDLTEITALSLTDLHKHLKSLTEAGIEIEQKDTTLQWSQPFDCLDQRVINDALNVHTEINVQVQDVVQSTNTTLGALESVHRKVLLTEFQSSGRGRLGRHWQSPVGKNIYMSVGWSLDKDALHPAISLCVGSAVIAVLEQIGIKNAGVKWPNDLYVGHSKIGGILIESSVYKASANLVIGIGLNVHQQTFESPLSVSATTVEKETGVKFDRDDIAIKIITAVAEVMSQIEVGKIKDLLLHWQHHDVSYNQNVIVHLQDNEYTGIARGIDTMGNLKVEIDNEIRVFNSADISLRLNK